MVRTIELFRKYCLGDDPVRIQVLSDQTVNFSRRAGRRKAPRSTPGEEPRVGKGSRRSPSFPLPPSPARLERSLPVPCPRTPAASLLAAQPLPSSLVLLLT